MWFIDDIAVVQTTWNGFSKPIVDIRVYLERLGLARSPIESNLEEPEVDPKIDSFGNNYFGAGGMPHTHKSGQSPPPVLTYPTW